MTADPCRVWRERLGAFVLDQLGPAERAATEAHLEGCPGCRAEVDELAPMAGMLRRADPRQLAPTPTPPPYLAERIAGRIAAERRAARRRRVRMAIGLGIATAAVAATAVLAVTLIGSTSDGPATETVAFRDLPRGVSVDASLEARPWGSKVYIRARGFRPGTLCMVWLRRADGTRVPAGSFRYVYAGESDEAELSSGLDPPDVTAVGLEAGSRTFVAPTASRASGSASGRS